TAIECAGRYSWSRTSQQHRHARLRSVRVSRATIGLQGVVFGGDERNRACELDGVSGPRRISTSTSTLSTCRESLFENIEDFLWKAFAFRLIPIFFEPFLPILGPGTSVVIDEVRVVGRQLLRITIHVLDIAQALDIRVSAVLIVHGSPAGEAKRGAHGRYERIWIVENSLVVEPDEFAARIECGLPRF